MKNVVVLFSILDIIRLQNYLKASCDYKKKRPALMTERFTELDKMITC